MKRFVTMLLATLALAGLLCVSASASSFDGAAAELASIGMLKGTAGGFDLDKAPTRGQAAIMLVRLFGAEEEAKAAYAAGKLKCPFTDVNETTAPFAAWLADKGLASGTSATTFGGGNACTAKAYTIFLLRALGYRDNVDFTTASAQEFAMGLGLLDTSVLTGKFLRDDLVSLTYQALGTDLKDGGTYLLDSLVKSGAVGASAAKPITDKIEAYRALQSSGAAMGQRVDASIDARMKITVSVSGAGQTMSESQEAAVSGGIQVIADKDVQMAMDLTVTMNDGENTETEKMEYWLKDGVTYVRSGEDAYQMPAVVDMESLQSLMEQSAGQTGAAMLPFIKSIAVKTSGGETVYTITLNDAFAGLMDSIFRTVLQEVPVEMDMKISLDGASIAYKADQDGNLKSASVHMPLKVEAKGDMTFSVGADMDMTMDIKAAGKNVKITFPDFSGFEKIMGGADGPTAIWGTAA